MQESALEVVADTQVEKPSWSELTPATDIKLEEVVEDVVDS